VVCLFTFYITRLYGDCSKLTSLAGHAAWINAVPASHCFVKDCCQIAGVQAGAEFGPLLVLHNIEHDE